MSLFTASIASGSNGNCYYIGNEQEAVLVDAGISCRETEKRMRSLGLPLQRVKAIFISHEHGDHIRGLEVLSKRHGIPVYITEPTRRFGRLNLEERLVSSFRAYEPVQIGNISVTGFPKFHDASDPHSFMVCDGRATVGVFTDIGVSCEHVVRNFKACNAVFLEANYDERMLESGRYPYHLKQRIRGGKGHLSNSQALELFLSHRSDRLSHLFLSHLSQDNNCPDLVHRLFSEQAGSTNVIVASRYKATAVYEISNGGNRPSVQGLQLDIVQRPVQASLF